MVSDTQRVARFTRHSLVYGTPAAVSEENRRQTFDVKDGDEEAAFRQALRYLEDGLGSSAADLGAIVRVSVSVLPQTRRRNWSELSPNQQKRYAGSRQAKEEARQHGATVQEWYKLAPDLKAFRGHARGRPPKVVYLGQSYVTYIAESTPTGRDAPDKTPRELSKGPKDAWRRRKRNERRRERYAAAKARR
jgi:hypothetical protein